ncbi:hypothetical protein MMC16_000598 [Acarospora aff. strigata]|nr:hypothetical protein [Acarospora aff. strigata]
MGGAVNFTAPFTTPPGPDFRQSYMISETVKLEWDLPTKVSISLYYTNETDERVKESSYTWTLLRMPLAVLFSSHPYPIQRPLPMYDQLPSQQYSQGNSPDNVTNQNFFFWQLDPQNIQPAEHGRLLLSWYPGGPGFDRASPQSAESPKFHVNRHRSTTAEVGVGIVVPIGVVGIIAGLWWFYAKRTPWGKRARDRGSREIVR